MPARRNGSRRRALVAAAASLCACLAAAPAPAASTARPAAAGERSLRAYETSVLGSRHAAEHAALRAAERALPPQTAAQRRRMRLRAARAARFVTRQAGAASQVGSWEPPFPIPTFGIHAALLATGKVLLYGYPPRPPTEPIRPNEGRAWLWDPAQGTGVSAFKAVPPPPGPDGKPAPIYCSGEAFLADGRLLLTGGNLRFPHDGLDYAGANQAFIFDPFTETWSEQPKMHDGRWYPSQVELADGRQVVVGGYDGSDPGAHNTQDVEVFTPPAPGQAQGSFALQPQAARATALYPHMFVMPSGQVLLAGPAQGDSGLLSTTSFTWSPLPAPVRERVGGNAVLLPGGFAGSQRVMQIGGYDYDAANPSGPFFSDPTAESIDLSAPKPAWTLAAHAPSVARSYGNTVLLPDGSMVLVGGGAGRIGAAQNYAVYDDGRARQVELYDRVNGTWGLGAAQQEDRAYHSTAVLLPDGRVLSAGDDMHPDTQSDNAEIYSPPYLFKGPRPAITSAPQAVWWGSAFGIGTPDRVTRAVLVAPSATTHGADMTQRHVELRIVYRASGKGVDVLAPASANLAPPGFYMLFLLNEAGVPAVARFVRLGADAPRAARFDNTPPVLRMRLLTPSLRSLRRHARLRVRVSVSEAANVVLGATTPRRARGARVKRRRPLKLGTATIAFDRAGSGTVTMALSRAVQRALRRRSAVRISLNATARDLSGNARRGRLARTLRGVSR